MNGVVNLVISSVKQGDGIESVANGLVKLTGDAGAFGRAIEIIGGKLGPLGADFVKVAKNLALGGVWELAASGLRLVIGLWQKHKEQMEANAKAIQDRYVASIKEYAKACKEGLDAEIKLIDDSLKRTNDKIDANQRLLESELRLKKAREGASQAEIDREIASSRAESRSAKAANEIAMGQELENVRKKYLAEEETKLSSLGDQLASFESQAVEKMRKKRESFEVDARFDVLNSRNSDIAPEFVDEMIRRRVAKKMKKWEAEHNEDELYGKEISALVTAINDTYKNMRTIEKSIEDAAEDRKSKDVKDRAEANEDLAKRIENEKTASENTIRVVVREINDRLSKAKDSFEREFALYRDPERMNAVYDEAEKRKDDLERMKKDVSRKNVGYMVDEAARLMRAGDEEGLDARFRDWRAQGGIRKGDRETEQLIRTAAAYETKTTAEDELRKIESNTKDLAGKIEELIAMK